MVAVKITLGKFAFLRDEIPRSTILKGIRCKFLMRKFV